MLSVICYPSKVVGMLIGNMGETAPRLEKIHILLNMCGIVASCAAVHNAWHATVEKLINIYHVSLTGMVSRNSKNAN